MKKQHGLATGIIFLFLLIGLFTSVAHSEDKIHSMTGKISTINLAHNTVVIQVPLGSQTFTVGGPLDADATLTKNGGPADLTDFKVGETANVRWRTTPKGHLIVSLTVR